MSNYKNFTKIDKVLTKTSKAYKLDLALARYQILKHWQNIIVGFFENGAEETRAMDFKKGVLFVACLSKDIAYRIKVLASRIIYALNQVLGKDLVFAINVES